MIKLKKKITKDLKQKITIEKIMMKAEIKNNQRTSKDFCLKGEIGKKNQFNKKIQKKKSEDQIGEKQHITNCD